MTEFDPVLSTDFELANLLDVRRDVQQAGSQCGLTDLRLYYFVVAVNEVMTNAIHHGGGHGTLRIAWAGEYFECEVVDAGPGIPPEKLDPATAPAADTLTGRGLWLTRQLCDKVEVVSDSTGTRVTLIFRP